MCPSGLQSKAAERAAKCQRAAMKLLKCVTELQQSPQKARGQREGAGQPLGTHGCSIRCTFFPWFVCCLCFCVGLLFCLLVCLFPKHALFSVFSKFGLLYSVRAHSNAAVAGPGCYAIIKFYSAADASRAQQACNGQKLFQNSPMKVRRTAKLCHPSAPGPSAAGQELWVDLLISEMLSVLTCSLLP